MTAEALKYIRDVKSRKIIVGKYTRLAIERHERDLKASKKKDFGYYYDPNLAQIVVDFIEFLTHVEGKLAWHPIRLEGWQCFIVCSLFGWRRKSDGGRRFRKAYLTVARKNGKSTLAAGILLYCLVADGEIGAQVYSAATRQEQAKLLWDIAEHMVQANEDLLTLVKVWRSSLTISVESTNSRFQPLAAQAKKLDGFNPSAACIDEYHAHPTNKVYGVIETGMGTRVNPLLLITTTAGFNLNSPCKEEDKYVSDILEGIQLNENYFGIIYRPDDGDDWTQESAWHKANPNMHLKELYEFIKSAVDEARRSASKTNEVKTKHLNLWTQTVTRWITDDVWMGCKHSTLGPGALELENFRGRKGFLAYDLSASQDITAIILDIQPRTEGEKHVLLAWFFIPGDNVKEKEDLDHFAYQHHIDQQWIIATPGNVIDYDFIETIILEIGLVVEIIEIAYDPWKALEIVNHLEPHGFTMVPIAQTMRGMAVLTDSFEKAVLGKKIDHGGNPILRWMASNTELRSDSHGNFAPAKPRRDTAGKKIDGIVASIMAYGRASINELAGKSVYDDHGIREI